MINVTAMTDSDKSLSMQVDPPWVNISYLYIISQRVILSESFEGEFTLYRKFWIDLAPVNIFKTRVNQNNITMILRPQKVKTCRTRATCSPISIMSGE